MPRPNIKQKDIEDAAIRLFASKGLSRTTIRDIAAAAGVTEGALYRHYPGKDEMAWALFVRELDRFTRDLGDRLFDPVLAGAARLEAGIRFMYGYYAEDPVTFQFIMLTQHGFPGEKLLNEETNPNDMAVRFIAGLMDRGEIPAGDPVAMAGMVMGLVLQPLVMHCYGRLQLNPALVDSVVAAAKRTVGLD